MRDVAPGSAKMGFALLYPYALKNFGNKKKPMIRLSSFPASAMNVEDVLRHAL